MYLWMALKNSFSCIVKQSFQKESCFLIQLFKNKKAMLILNHTKRALNVYYVAKYHKDAHS